ncbi:hypothetical protein NC651_004755 [Populus alba x Populus x berolinensis]|nr:hypothetical protein NC651_004755 [Populus alba x Populus x berolinensis]
MLNSILDLFSEPEFYYVDRGIVVAGDDVIEEYPCLPLSEDHQSDRKENVASLSKVPPNGLSEELTKRLQQCRECTSQILKAAMAINSSVLAEMEIPDAILRTCPRYRNPALLNYMCVDESVVHVNGYCMVKYLGRARDRRSSWGGKVKGFVGETQKRKLLAKRAEILIHNLRLRFPGLPQTALDVNKIQYNKDVGYAIIESYSRVMESLAFNIMARIDDLLYVDDATKQRATAVSVSPCVQGKF